MILINSSVSAGKESVSAICICQIGQVIEFLHASVPSFEKQS